MKENSAGDKAIEQLVADKLRQGAPTPATTCPNAEIIAAYFERTLAPRERASWEVHFDSCPRCQARIAALVRMDQADEASLTVPKAASTAPARKVLGLRWAWTAPVLLAAVVAGLWYTGEFEPFLHQTTEIGARVSSPSPTKPPETSAAVKEKEPPAPPGEKRQSKAPSTPPANDQLRASAKLPEQRSANAPSIEAQVPPENQPPETVRKLNVGTENQHEAPAPSPAEPKANPQAAGAQGAIALPAERARLEAAPDSRRGSSVADRGAVGGAPAASAVKREPGTRDESSVVEAGTPTASQSRSMTALGAFVAKNDLVRTKASSEAQGAAGLLGGSGVHYAIVSAKSDKDLGKTSSPELWRVGPHGLIQKQNPNGLWGTKSSGVSADLYDITFPSPQVGWAVGQSGVVLRSANGGEGWVRVSSPTKEDLVRVTATSAELATVTTRSGIVFSTTDGAMSWTRSTGAP